MMDSKKEEKLQAHHHQEDIWNTTNIYLRQIDPTITVKRKTLTRKYYKHIIP